MASTVTLDTFDHIGIIVKDAKAASESWSAKLGIADWKFRDVGILILAHARIGPMQYELIQPVEGHESLWADFLENNGEGLHHICHTVSDVDEAAGRLVEEGGEILVSTPKFFAYVRTGGPGSVILELLKTPKPK